MLFEGNIGNLEGKQLSQSKEIVVYPEASKEKMVIKSFIESETYVGIGPLGSTKGKKWTYKPETPIKHIIIYRGVVIDSLVFICENGQTSPKFGSTGGSLAEVKLEHPDEYLTGLSGTIGSFHGADTVTSLSFHTNLKTYGPFGNGGGFTFTLPVEDGVIVGFHGRSGAYITAIGMYVRPISSAVPLIAIAQPDLATSSMADFFPRNPGPFGGSHGRDWDDGVFSGVKKVVVNVNEDVNVIQSVEFEYVSTKPEGGVVLSPHHGGSGNVIQRVIYIDYPSEYLMGVAGYYSSVESDGGQETIRSIKFMTNKGVYGPYGNEIGTYFASTAASGKILGFYGRAGAYLNAIGVHMEYI